MIANKPLQSNNNSAPIAANSITHRNEANSPLREAGIWVFAARSGKGHYSARLLAWGGTIVLLAALAIRCFMLSASLAHIPVTADEAITVLQAKRVVEGQWPLLVYAQPYQFPVEAYLSAPLVQWAPRTTLGARYVAFFEGFLTLFLLALIARRTGSFRDTWPMLLLIMFPSAYLLTIQFGYSLPHNSPFYLAAWGAMLLTIDTPLRFTAPCCSRFLLAGILCGLAFTNNMLALSMIAPILTVAAIQGNWRHILPKLFLLASGVCIGLVPYFMAIHLYPGAHASVAGTRSIGNALEYLWEPGITVTLTRALGITPTLFPDTAHHLDFAAWLFPILPFIIVVALLAAAVLRATAIIRQLIRNHTLGLNVLDAFIGVVCLNLVLFSASDRSTAGSYRYLAPAAWSFPFLIGAVYISSGKWMRRLIGAACIAMVIVNIMTAVKLTEAWGRPDFAERVVDAPDVKPAIDFLRQQGITHCVAYHWQAYRLNFYTDETIIFSQPYNDRFRDWPMPYKEQVDASTNVAYVLSEFSCQDFNPPRFEADLKRMQITAQKAVRGQFSIYHGFIPVNEFTSEESLIPSKMLTVTTSHNQAEAENLVNTRRSNWSTQRRQEQGMWIQIDLKHPQWLSRIVLVYDNFYTDSAPMMNIEVKSDGQWQLMGDPIARNIAPCEFENGKPIYNRFVQVIRSNPVFTDGLRLTIVETDPRYWWTLTKIDLYTRPAPVSQ